jgi:5-methylcytosine-specific restriction endonuclease McrA
MARWRRKEPHCALYGNTGLVRVWCSVCKTNAFVIDGLRACCDRPAPTATPEKWVSVTAPQAIRRAPPKAQRLAVLASQGGACLYCDRLFGDTVLVKRKLITLRATWDHRVPWSFSMDNRPANFVAACQVCNACKSNEMFATVEEVRQHVEKYWASRLA